ncbi:hypothetical protein FBUS_06397 [Fasciolopsis buskii]|uniref:Uncharacterized protein n=1 Tax=Fasciolopsis buskii TaxID=27845 RepID=A0A8E0RW60_9TREM|nr:hypothetical protein FBUS_06397 [Fasciolopsis buski]
MDLATVLGHNFMSGTLPGQKLALLLSHGLIDHGPLICDIVGRILCSSPSTVGDTSKLENTNTRSCLFFALQRAANIYERSLGSTSQRFLKNHHSVQYFDLSVWLKSKFLERDSTESNFGPCSQISVDLCTHLADQIFEFLQKHSGTDEILTVIFDDITILVDLGIPLGDIHRLLFSVIPLGDDKQLNVQIILGCHVGELFDGALTSASDPSFAHWIDLLHSRADWVIESRPLATGYITALDGEVSCLPFDFFHSTCSSISDNPFTRALAKCFGRS